MAFGFWKIARLPRSLSLPQSLRLLCPDSTIAANVVCQPFLPHAVVAIRPFSDEVSAGLAFLCGDGVISIPFVNATKILTASAPTSCAPPTSGMLRERSVREPAFAGAGRGR